MLTFALLATSSLIAGILTFHGDYLLLITTACLAATLLVVSRRHLAPTLLSPVQLVALAYGAFAIMGLILYPVVADATAGAGVRIYMDAGLRLQTAELFMFASAAVLTGCLLVLLLRRGTHTAFKQTSIRPGRLSSNAQTALLLLSTLAPILIVLGASDGIETLLSRPEYIRDHYGGSYTRIGNPSLFSLGEQLATAAVLFLGYLIVGTESRWIRRASILVVLIDVLVFFSLASRRLALVPILFVVGAYAAKPASMRIKRHVMFATISAIFIIEILLYLRTLPAHGLLSYWEAFAGGDIFHYEAGIDSIARNVLISFAIVGDTAFTVPQIPESHLFLSIHPLPGFMTDWYSVADMHRLNSWQPYSGIGELANYGMAWFAAYFVLVGAVFSYIDLLLRRLFVEGRQLLALPLVGLSALFVVLSLQYHLRTMSRIIYYLILFSVVLEVGRRLMPPQRDVTESTGLEGARSRSNASE